MQAETFIAGTRTRILRVTGDVVPSAFVTKIKAPLEAEGAAQSLSEEARRDYCFCHDAPPDI